MDLADPCTLAKPRTQNQKFPLGQQEILNREPKMRGRFQVQIFFALIPPKGRLHVSTILNAISNDLTSSEFHGRKLTLLPLLKNRGSGPKGFIPKPEPIRTASLVSDGHFSRRLAATIG